MTQSVWRWTVGLVLTGLLVAAAPQQTTVAEQPQQQLAAVEQLKTDAFSALKRGKFPESYELLAKAAEMSPDDTQVRRMADWVKQFEAQRQEFAAERHKQFDKAVADVRKLIENHKESYALDATARASLLSDDKKAFRAEPWVDALIKQTVAMAEEFDKNEQWLKAMRLYADLSSIEPGVAEWKEKLKLATRRIRLLALYTPGGIKALQEGEAKEREEVDKLLNPSTQPTYAFATDESAATTQVATTVPSSQPTTSVAVALDLLGQTTQPTTAPGSDKFVATTQVATTGPSSPPTTNLADAEDDATDAFKIDWRQTVEGVNALMLTEALKNARTNYYRQVEYKDLLAGGIKGLRTLATTRGLEQTFPGLGNEAKRKAFVEEMDKRLEEAKGVGNNARVVDDMLAKVRGNNRETIDLEEGVLIAEFADGAFAELDMFSSMIWPSDLEEFNKTTQGEFSGVGIQIQLDEDGSLKVVSPLEDSPAYKAGIKAGDVITRINGKNAKGITLNQAVKTITGPSGTMVKLTVRSPSGSVKDYDIERRTIKVASIKGWLHRPGGGWDYFVDEENKIAYLRLTNFTKGTSEELDKAAKEIQSKEARALILDLRYNPGGLLSAATDVTDKFLNEGLIVKTEAARDTPNPPTYATARNDDNELTLPTVVLVNQYSASASEIVSGALKDHSRSKVVGERTFGKGSVQMLFPLAERRAYLKLTTSHYYLPGGKCIHREENSTEWGVDPDLTIEMTPEQMRAAIDARQDLDVLRDADPIEPARGKDDANKEAAQDAKEIVAKATKDPMASDPQLSAALLLLRMQLAGAQL